MRAAVAIALCFVTLLAIVPSPSAAGTEPAALQLALTDTDHVMLDLEGTGWAFVHITALDDMELNFTLAHDTVDDLCVFSRAGEGLYDEGHVSMFALWNVDDPLFTGETFWWHGAPGWDPGPAQSGACGESDALVLAAGDTASFVLADTTGGYTATLTAENAGPASQLHALALTRHPHFQRIDPTPTDTSVASASGLDVLRERRWTASFDVDHTLVLFADWDHDTGAPATQQGAYGTTYWQTKKMGPAGGGPDNPYASVIPTTDVDTTSPNGRSWSMNVRGQEVTGAGGYESRYTRGEITANIDSVLDVGAYTITVPLAP